MTITHNKGGGPDWNAIKNHSQVDRFPDRNAIKNHSQVEVASDQSIFIFPVLPHFLSVLSSICNL